MRLPTIIGTMMTGLAMPDGRRRSRHCNESMFVTLGRASARDTKGSSSSMFHSARAGQPSAATRPNPPSVARSNNATEARPNARATPRLLSRAYARRNTHAARGWLNMPPAGAVGTSRPRLIEAESDCRASSGPPQIGLSDHLMGFVLKRRTHSPRVIGLPCLL